MGAIIKCNAQLKHKYQKYQKYPLQQSSFTTPKKYFNESSEEIEESIQVHPLEVQQAVVSGKNPQENKQNIKEQALQQTILLKEDDDIVQYRTLQQTISNTLANQLFQNNASLSKQNFNEDNYFELEEIQKYEQQLQKFKKGKRIQGTKISWKKGELIGTGSFGRVYKGLNLVTGEIIAIKQFFITGNSKEQEAQKRKILEQEIELLSTLTHKNIVKYQGIERDNENINIFLEYVSGGSLSQMITKFGSLNDTLVRLYTRQILEGLEYLHVNEVVHRDIKGANVLIEKNGTAKLSDFGSAKRIVTQVTDYEQSQTLTGTPNWFKFFSFLSIQRMAPEVIKFSDIWSLGCTVIEMATGKPPYHQYKNPIMAMFNIAHDATPPQFPDNCSNVLRDFLEHCFRKVPKERFNISKLLNHRFITGTQELNQNLSSSGEQLKTKEKRANTSGNTKEVYFNKEQNNPLQELKQQKSQEGAKFNSNLLNFIECRQEQDEKSEADPSWMANKLFNFSIKNQEVKQIFPRSKQIVAVPQSPELQADVEKQKNNQFLSTIDSTNYLQIYDTDQNKVSINSQINLKLFDGKQSSIFQNQNHKMQTSIFQSKEKKMLNWLDQKGTLFEETNQSLAKYNDLKLLEFIDEDENSFIDDTQQQNITPKELQHSCNFKLKEQNSIEKTQELQLVLESLEKPTEK